MAQNTNSRDNLKDFNNKFYPQPTSIFTDFFWTLLFGGFIFLNVVVVGPILAEGQVSTLGHFYDNSGNRCGQGNATEFPITYLPGLPTDMNQSFCIKSCPLTAADSVTALAGSPTAVKSTQVFTLCVPHGFNVANMLKTLLKKYKIGGWVSDIPLYYKYLPLFLVTSIVLSLIYLYILKTTASILIRGSNLVLILALAFLSYLVGTGQLELNLFTHFFEYSWCEQADEYLQYAIVAICPIWTLLYLCYFRSKMLISSGIIEAGADAVGDMPSTLVVSFLSIISLVLTLTFWLYTFFSYLSNKVTGRAGSSFFYELDFNYQDWKLYFLGFNFIYWFWFVECAFKFVLASMFSNWYYFQNGQNDLAGPAGSLSKALARALWSVGTIAIGSFVISVATVLRVLIGWYSHKAKEVGADSNFLVRWSIYLANFFAWLFEKICQQFTKYAYIHASFTGDNFFSSAWTSMCVNLSNLGLFSTLQMMEEVLVWGGKAAIIFLNLLLAYVLFVVDILDVGIKAEQLPVGTFSLIAIISYIVSSSFLSLFDEAADTIMYCFFFDYDRKGAPPVNYPYQLKNYLEEINRQKREWDEKFYNRKLD